MIYAVFLLQSGPLYVHLKKICLDLIVIYAVLAIFQPFTETVQLFSNKAAHETLREAKLQTNYVVMSFHHRLRDCQAKNRRQNCRKSN